MSRFKEIRRIENAIKNRNLDDLLWSQDYCSWRVNNAYNMHPNKIAKGAQKQWQKRLDEVQEVIETLNEEN